MSEIYFQCSECEKKFDINPSLYLCTECEKKQKNDEPLRGVLEVIFSGEILQLEELIPVDPQFFPPVPVGWTPLWTVPRIREKYGFNNLFIKDDGQNPTGSFKDRASFLVSAYAKAHGINEIVLASTGNAGSSMAGIGASVGQQITLFLPKSAPVAKIAQALQFGANVYTVDGNYDKAYDLSMEYTKKFGGMNRNTAYNPMTIEGKKSVSLEIYDEFQDSVPDYIFVSVGDGCILGGVYKGFIDLMKHSFSTKIPTIIAVQAEGSDAFSRAMENGGVFSNKPTSTVADSICVDVPRNGYLATKYMREYEGEWVRVSDEEILDAQLELSSSSGLFTEPAGATAYAGFLKYVEKIEKDKSIVILATGSGLKDIQNSLIKVSMPETAISSLDDIQR